MIPESRGLRLPAEVQVAQPPAGIGPRSGPMGSAPARLVLVRHTPVKGVQGLCYGRTDVDLPESFAQDAEAVRAALPPAPWTLYASPARRCRRLAEWLGGGVTTDPRLQELDFGDWEGRAWNDLPRPELDRWCGDFVGLRPPGGEAFAELAARAGDFAAEMAGRHAGGCVVAVTHAGVIRALLAARSGLPYADAFSIAVAPGSVHVLDTGCRRAGPGQSNIGLTGGNQPIKLLAKARS